MRVGVDFLREDECEECKSIMTFSKLSSLLTYSVNARPPGRAFPALRRMCRWLALSLCHSFSEPILALLLTIAFLSFSSAPLWLADRGAQPFRSSHRRRNSLLRPCGPVILNYLSTFHRIEHSLINLFRSYLSHCFYDLNSVIAALLASPPFPRCAAVVDFYLYNCCSRVSN
jgi:hypothetical protein